MNRHAFSRPDQLPIGWGYLTADLELLASARLRQRMETLRRREGFYQPEAPRRDQMPAAHAEPAVMPVRLLQLSPIRLIDPGWPSQQGNRHGMRSVDLESSSSSDDDGSPNTASNPTLSQPRPRHRVRNLNHTRPTFANRTMRYNQNNFENPFYPNYNAVGYNPNHVSIYNNPLSNSNHIIPNSMGPGVNSATINGHANSSSCECNARPVVSASAGGSSTDFFDMDYSEEDVEESSDDEEGCPICLEHWTDEGEHRLVSLKCGHLFGLGCVEKWLEGHPVTKRTCPTCKNKAKIKDIRPIFSTRVISGTVRRLRRSVRQLRRQKKTLQAELRELTKDIKEV